MGPAASLPRLIARVALMGCAFMAAIVLSSAFLRLTNAGIGCVDWPQCYGQVARADKAAGVEASQAPAVRYTRLLHRASAMLVAVAAVLLLMLSLTRGGRTRVNLTASVCLCVLTLGLALIGRASAGTLVPLIGLLNLTGGFAMLALFWLLWLQNQEHPRTSKRTIHGPWRGGAYLALLLLSLQIGVGALATSTYSATACTGLLDCAPAVDDGTAASFDLAAPLDVDAGQRVIAPRGAAKLQLIHRIAGFALGAMLLSAGAWLARDAALRGLGCAIALAALAEVALGLDLVIKGFPLAIELLHNAVAAVSLLLSVSLACRLTEPRQAQDH